MQCTHNPVPNGIDNMADMWWQGSSSESSCT